MKNRTRIFLLSILFASFVAHSDSLDQSTKDTFLSGQTRLSAAMFNRAYANLDDAKKMIAEEKWSDLVNFAISRKFDGDIHYYLLGRAAEGMGAIPAATTYYNLALAAKDKCVGYTYGDGCMGLKFPWAISERSVGMTPNTSRGKSTTWGVGTGPIVSEVALTKHVKIDELSNITSRDTSVKGKFETDAEFSARGGAKAIERLLVFKLPTDDEKRCKTSYDHTAGKYVINKCWALSGQFPVLKKTELGESFSLANMVDKRDIKRNLHKSYFLNSIFLWNAEFSVSREFAAAIDDDLMVGVQFGKFSITSNCDECDARRVKSATADLIGSIGSLQGKTIDTSDVDWKKDAFRNGSIEESWVYTITPDKIVKIVMFRKSDSRVLFEFDAD